MEQPFFLSCRATIFLVMSNDLLLLSCRATIFLVMSSDHFSCHVERPQGVETSLYTSALKISPLTSFGRNDKWSDRFSCHVERPTGVETSSYMSVLKISPLTSFGRNDKARQARPVTQFSIMLSYGRPARRSSHLPWEAGREQTSTVSNRIGKFLA